LTNGGSDPGAVGYIVEEDVNLNMAAACRDYLVANGVEVKMSRTTDENDDLNEEIRECNAYNPDLAVDVHNNAGGGDGFEIYHTLNGGKGKTLAENIEKEVLAIGQNSRGVKTKRGKNGDYYGFIRLTKCPAVIAEGVFVDNKKDASQADTLEEQKAFGVAYAKGILKTLGITERSTTKPQTTRSIIDLAHEVMQGKYGNGEARKKALGSLYDEVQAKVNELLKYNHSYYPACNQKHTSIVDALKSIGVDSSFESRKKIAQKNNVRNYQGTAVQNIQLLSKLKAGRLIK